MECSEHRKKLDRQSKPPEFDGPRLLERASRITSHSSGNKKEEEIVTVEETAEYLKVQPSTVYSWVENGQIPYIKMGRLIRFMRSDVREWLVSQRSEPESHKKIKIASKLCGNLDIDRLVKKTIDSESNVRYKKSQGKPRQSRARREVSHGYL